MIRHFIIQAACILGAASSGFGEVSLFDGKSLSGWEIRKGEEKWWKVEDDMIVGGSLSETVPFNTFISSRESYENFELSYKIRLIKGDGFMNSGMQIRSSRSEADSEMIGYQVDAGAGYWGDIYDESRRNKALTKGRPDIASDWEWNDYRILCEGPRIRIWINGKEAADYIETESTIPMRGKLGLQAHGGGKFLVQMKDIAIKEMPLAGGARSPEAQRASFKLPSGYSAELVASEEQGVGKPITVAWDRHGRMWTTTALEYPVDANENEAAARELYKTGGKDRVLVFDEPGKPGPLTPRVFADKLAIPLGVLPTADGTYVQHGSEIRRYHDVDDDGKADSHEVVLEGFGIQDSHLFPHQFERTPGGWIYLAQGAFNYSKVSPAGGANFKTGPTPVEFNNCKLARFRPDGSEFVPLTGGPNNIWGLAITRDGETFIQEANDLGYPVAESAPGTHYPAFSGPRMREDAPILPQSMPTQPMGGTGLSGLALSEDTDSPFSKDQGEGSVFYLANPITSKIQVVTMTRDSSGHPIYQKGRDFMVTDDPWFRPIAIHFGPDGFLYVVDWYNKIISHNEVPRSHPDRDKSRGRIWRIKHDSQTVPARMDLAKASDDTLLDLLGGSGARLSMQAWQEIGDRKAKGLTGKLGAIASDEGQSTARRCAALWALEELRMVSPALLVKLASATQSGLRHEAVRISGETSIPEEDFTAVMKSLGDEKNFRVRAAIANAVRFHQQPTPSILAFAARLGLAPSGDKSREAYDRNFERYLVRWALSSHPAATREMLSTHELPVEARMLAARSFDAPEAAASMVKLLPEIDRPLIAEELNLLGSQLGQPEVGKNFSEQLADPARRETMLRTMTGLDPRIAAIPELADAVATSAVALLAEKRTDETERLALNLARRFRLARLSDQVTAWTIAPGRDEKDLAEGLATLRESGSVDIALFRSYLDHSSAIVRREALIGFGSSPDASVVTEFRNRWKDFSGANRSLAVDGMTAGKPKAEAFARALVEGGFPGFDGTAVEKLIAALGVEHPTVAEMLKANEGLLQPVIRLGENGAGRVLTNTSLKGPFTVETWIKLDEGIDQNDSLLGKKDGPDFNFAGERLRVYGGLGAGDILIANRPMKAGVWTHCAITRDAGNRFHIYLDGEPDPAESGVFAEDYDGMNVAENFRGTSSSANYDEFRIWNIARSGEEIRRDFRTRFGASAPDGLVFTTSGRSLVGKLEGGARISLVRDFPDLVTPEDAAALDRKFDRFRKTAETPGDIAAGKQLVQTTCMICHQINGEGTAIGPNLSGAGAMGTEALLRNILTPNAQLESGYYRHDIKLKDGTVTSGFLAGENDESITLRQIGADDRVLRRTDVITHEISRRSLMPEGLIDGFTPTQVSDLFTYLKSLR